MIVTGQVQTNGYKILMMFLYLAQDNVVHVCDFSLVYLKLLNPTWEHLKCELCVAWIGL